jgi:hypothetical protein
MICLLYGAERQPVQLHPDGILDGGVHSVGGASRPGNSRNRSVPLGRPFPRQASTDQRESADKTDPKLAAEPTESTDAIEPADPMDKIDPAEPMDRIEPEEPIDRIDPLDPMLKMEPSVFRMRSFSPTR